MDDGRVTLNVGGRVFETTALTLKTSGAGYFEALRGETGARLPGSKKRARVSEDGDDAPGHRELFIDRDPDRFADVLSFMRTDRLSAAAAKDSDRLQDLKVEAEFLAYDALFNACDAAEAALVETSRLRVERTLIDNELREIREERGEIVLDAAQVQMELLKGIAKILRHLVLMFLKLGLIF